MIRRFLNWLFPKKRKRLELRVMSYLDADMLMRDEPGVWLIAEEEDDNKRFGIVYIERLEPK